MFTLKPIRHPSTRPFVALCGRFNDTNGLEDSFAVPALAHVGEMSTFGRLWLMIARGGMLISERRRGPFDFSCRLGGRQSSRFQDFPDFQMFKFSKSFQVIIWMTRSLWNPDPIKIGGSPETVLDDAWVSNHVHSILILRNNG